MKNFTAKQKEIIARKLGYDGPMQGFDEFVQSSPALAMKYEMINDKYTERMNKGGAVMRYQDGGSVPGGMIQTPEINIAANASVDDKKKEYSRLLSQGFDDAAIRTAAESKFGKQTDADWQVLSGRAADDGKKRITLPDRSKETGSTAGGGTTGGGAAGGGNIAINIDPATATPQQKAAEYNRLRSQGFTDEQIKAAATTKFGAQAAADWSKLQDIASKSGTTLSEKTPGMEYTETGVPKAGAIKTVQAQQTAVDTGKLTAADYDIGAVDKAGLTTAKAAADVATPAQVGAQSVETVKTATDIAKAVSPIKAATGVAPEIQAQQLTPEQMQASMAQAQTLDQAQKVQQAQRTLQEGELVSGPAVDMKRAEEAIAQTKAEQGQVTEDMTVQGQLTKLTANFDAANPPPWAAGAIRTVTAQLAARGLAASSMAGQAVVQAALESAIPIATADAQAYRQMESQNLSNRQQVAVLAAQQRAQFLGQEFDQEFQTRVVNAAKIADIANMNFTAEQQVYLENARLAQSVDLANLNNRQATVIANAATLANMQMANLSARQQTAVANAQNFLQMSIANMSNEQQVALFKAQAMTQSILSDAAAENSARQFNASSKQQAEQFNTKIATDVLQFNTAQKNAMEQFNAGQANSLAQFNAQMDAQREEFNSRNRVLIDQANAQLLAQISTANTAQVNATNFQNAQAMNNMTTAQYNNEVQLYRDQVKMVYDTYERAEDRAASMATAMLQVDIANKQIDAKTSESYGRLLSSLIGTDAGGKAVDKVVDWLGGLFG